jgi:sialidase-1
MYADNPRTAGKIALNDDLRERCLTVLQKGLHGDEFWPAMHAAEGLSVAGHGDEVRAFLAPKLDSETDDQRRCGLARELVRAGDLSQLRVLFDVLTNPNPHGHTHAAESLYKVYEIGDGAALRRAVAQPDTPTHGIMAAAALARCGNRQVLAGVRQQLQQAAPEVSRVCAWVLARVGDASDLPMLREKARVSDDPLTRVYYEHAQAALDDKEGRAALIRNLSDSDPAVRTYACEFAVDARVVEAADRLIELLDDVHADVRIRAANALLALAQPAADRREEISVVPFSATADHPRYTEGSVLRLHDGSILFATTEFGGDGNDFATAHIVARSSTDGGRTWGPQRVLQENTGKQNVMSVTLRRLRAPAPPGLIALFYLQKDAYDDLHAWVRFSADEGQSFGEPVLVTVDPGYHVVNNDRVTQLSTGRLVVPASSTADVQKENHFVAHCYLSDDGGQSWRAGTGKVDLPRRGAMEPEVIELEGGRLMMILRTQLGYVGATYSDDGGHTWNEGVSLGIQAPEAPATIRRIPATGDLLLVWNNTYVEGAGHGGARTPLTAAISSDEGRTWQHVRNLESDPRHTYAYTSILFVQDRVVLTYWDNDAGTNQYSSRFRSLPVSWFYSDDETE